ncbi:hypothetical protein EV361DRAFT_976184, partial [Lentinula raphanica]
MPIRTLLSVYVLATALLGSFAVGRPMPSTPSSQLQSFPASYNQIARREDSPDYHPHLQRRQQFSEPELLQIGRVGPDGQYLLRSEPHSTPGPTGLLVGTEFFDLPSSKFMTTNFPVPDPSQYSRYFQSLEVTVEFASDEGKTKVFASLRDLSYLRKECKRPNGFVNDLDYIDCALVIMELYVVGQDKDRILDKIWGKYKDTARLTCAELSSQSASAAPPAPPSVAAPAPAPGSVAPQMVQPAPVPAAPVQIVQPACDDHCVDYPSIAKPAETAEKPPPRSTLHQVTKRFIRRRGRIEGSFDYADCAVNYVGKSETRSTSWMQTGPVGKRFGDGIKAKRKEDIEAEAAKKP